MCLYVCLLFRLCPLTRHYQQVVLVYLHLKWVHMLSDFPSPFARKFVPVWMPPARVAVIGECWHAAWTLTGILAPVCLYLCECFTAWKMCLFF